MRYLFLNSLEKNELTTDFESKVDTKNYKAMNMINEKISVDIYAVISCLESTTEEDRINNFNNQIENIIKLSGTNLFISKVTDTSQ